MLNNLIKLNLKKKISISIVIFILIIGGLIYFVVMPTINDIKKMGEEIENLRIDLEQKYIKGQSLRQLTENLKKIEPQLVILDQIFIKQNYELEFITKLEEIADQNNVSQTINLDTAKINKDKSYQTLPLRLSMRGNYKNIMNYLISMEALNYYINIDSMDLSSASAKLSATPEVQTTFSNISLTISANTYWK
ncbi:type 4a pilus biogenesis protein PilO [Candidatus Parcubacteria bacterium]|nr:type 4a pilus biogenesis protein PilO [Candidatus Parcubacteria bacterium]